MMPPALSTRLSEEYRLPLTLALLVGWQTAPFTARRTYVDFKVLLCSQSSSGDVCMYVCMYKRLLDHASHGTVQGADCYLYL